VHEIPPPIKEQRLAIEALGRLGGKATKVEHEMPTMSLQFAILGLPDVESEGTEPPREPQVAPEVAQESET
jgi:hypothetical protein